MKILTLLLLAIPAFAADARVFENRKSEVRVLLQKQDYAAALEKAASINREWPDDQVGYQLVAAAQLALGNYSEAEKAIQWMLDLRIGKADAPGWLLVAQFREATGDMEGAMDAVNLGYNRSVPSDAAFSRLLLVYSAHLERTMRRLVEAEKQLKTALALNASDQGALEELAMLRMAQHRFVEADAILRPLTGSRDGSVHVARAQYELAQASKQPEDYAAFERAALPLVAQTDNLNRELALYYATIGSRPAEAERIARLEVTRRHDIFTLDAFAVALWSNRKAAEAQSTMKRVLAIGTRDPGILAHAKMIGVEVE